MPHLALDICSTSELLAELLARIRETNGLDFCSTESIDDLVGELQTYLVGADCTS